MEVRNLTTLSSGIRREQIYGPYKVKVGVVRFRIVREATQRGRFEFVGVQLQFYVIRVSGGVIRVRVVPISTRKGVRYAVNVYESAGKRRSGIVDHELSRGFSRNCGFRGDGCLYGPDVRPGRGVFRVLGISGKREKSYGREYRENAYDDDELDERKSSCAFFHAGGLNV